MSEIVKLFGEAEIADRVEEVRALNRAGASVEVEFMRLSSYGMGQQSSGDVRLLGDIGGDLAGRQLLLVDDIVDTGRSIAYAQALIRQREVSRLWTCALVDKPSRREVEVTMDFVGFSIEDVFIAGYGIDFAERYRDLPYIGVVQD
jgi:hypoxanthine phosphoribosyltransferase